jgi:hypothetical protein
MKKRRLELQKHHENNPLESYKLQFHLRALRKWTHPAFKHRSQEEQPASRASDSKRPAE